MRAPPRHRREPGYSIDRWASLLELLRQAEAEGKPRHLVRVPVVSGDQMVSVVDRDAPIGQMTFRDETIDDAIVHDAPALVAHVENLRSELTRASRMLDVLQRGEVEPRFNWPAYHELHASIEKLLK